MTKTLLDDAFVHHTWATLRIFDILLTLRPEQLATSIPGTYGSIRYTIGHLTGSDSYYLSFVTGDQSLNVDARELDLQQSRDVIERNGALWTRFLAGNPDPETIVREIEDRYERHAPLGVWLAQALHHGSDHRSQIFTALTSLGIEPPELDVWEHGAQTGSILEFCPLPDAL